MDEQLVIFELNNEAYGVDVSHVQSIIPMQKIVAVPGASGFVEGVVNLRGSVIPVVDLRHRFGLSLPENGQKSVIVVAELDTLQVGLVVDKVTEVIRLAEESIDPPSPLIANIDTAYLRGIGKFKKEAGEGDKTEDQDEDKMVILLDLERVFSQAEQQMLTEAA